MLANAGNAWRRKHWTFDEPKFSHEQANEISTK